MREANVIIRVGSPGYIKTQVNKFFSVIKCSSRWYLSESKYIVHLQIILACEMLSVTIIRDNVCSFLTN